MDLKTSDYVSITKIRATCRLSAHFYISVEYDGIITKTPSKTALAGSGVIDWYEETPLPTNLSSIVVFKVYASFELNKRLGDGELLWQFETSVGELLADQNERLKTIKFPTSKDEAAPSCLSLRIISERWNCDANECKRMPHLPAFNAKLEVLIEEGQSALLHYHRFKHRAILNRAIACFGLARHRCLKDHPRHSAAQFHLANAMFIECQAKSYDLSLDVPIKLYRDTLCLHTASHSDHVQTLLQLCLALLVRFKRRSDEMDKTEVERLLTRLAKFSLANSRVYQAGSRAPQIAGISYAEDADGVDLIHKGRDFLTTLSHRDPRRPVILAALGGLLSRRFKESGDLVDIHEAISMLEQVVQFVPNRHPWKPEYLNSLGVALRSRFERLGNTMDMERSIFTLEEALCLAPDGHPDKPIWLNSLGSVLFRRFERLGDIADISRSVSLNEEAIRLTPDGHLGKPIRLNHLGITLYRRFECLGDVADITKSVSMNEEAIRLTPDDHANKPALLNSLGNSLLRRFEHLGEVTDITKSVTIFEEAIRLSPDGHPDKPSLHNNLGNVLLSRFEHLGDVTDIMKSVVVTEEAVRLAPDCHPNRSGWLDNLGIRLSSRFERLGDVADITKSVSILEEAVRLIPDGHPDKPKRLSNLGHALFRRFERLGDVMDITKSVSMKEAAVHLTPDRHPNKPGLLNNLGSSLSRRFERLGDIADIEKSISIFEEAIHLTPDGHPDKPGLLHNLGNTLFRRFERLGDPTDITNSIPMFEKAIHLTPDGHPGKPFWLNGLGQALFCRFECLREVADIMKSVLLHEEAVRLIPHGHPDKPTLLNNLGRSLSGRFKCLGDVTDVTKLISIFEEAAHLTPDGHPSKPSRLRNLGTSFLTRFDDCSGHLSDLATATLHFSVAAQSSIGPSSDRFKAAHSWISSAQVEGNSQTLIDAYTTAIALLPQLAWMGHTVIERHRVLVDAADIVRNAAGAALDAGLPEVAVEWLEQGRSIVWTQFLQLRTPVDVLRITHPALADDFEQTSEQLESASTRGHVLSGELLDHDSVSQEKFVQRHHILTLHREKLLANIRSLPGFDRFLLPKTISQLISLAQFGPVVYLNASKQRCDALIIIAKQGSILPVPLPGVTYQHVEVMRRLLLKRDYSFIPHEDVLLLASSNQRNVIEGWDREGVPEYGEEHIPFDRFQLILGFLWCEVVHPVLKSLGISASTSRSEKMTRIFWCPTGPFAFLPIHAAGLYGTWAEPGAKLSDFAVSSYIPTLGTLTPSAGKDVTGQPPDIRLIAVPQPSSDGQSSLSNVQVEIAHIRASSEESQFVTLQDSNGTIEDVLEKMADADWVHFACHGVQDPSYPLDSGLCLADHRRLRLSDIIKLSRRPGGLAFLSACQTAKGDEKLSEESVHLAAGMLLAGYSGVIATMWSIMDNDAPKVARDVYKYLFRDGRVPDTTEAAEALHRAVVRLRDEDKVSFSSWVPFIHVGR